MRTNWIRWGVTAVLVVATTQLDAAHKWNLKEGNPALKSAGQLAFGPDGILFIGDATGAQVVAIDTGDAKAVADKPARDVERLDQKLAELAKADKVAVNDLAVNPLSGNIYLSVSIGAKNTPGLVKIDGKGELSQVSLDKVAFLAAKIANPPEDKVVGEGRRAKNRRPEAITDLAYVEGKLLVSGLTADKAPSAIREYPFPFADREAGTNIEIYHGAHGRLEDYAAVRTFIPLNIDGKPSLLAGFTCTPLVRFSLDDIGSTEKVRGTTVAELGNLNHPLDLIAYEKGDERFLLMANTARGVMKISTKGIGRDEGINEPIKETAGQEYETISELEGTKQVDKLTDDQIVVILEKDGALTLKTVMLP
jgi:hypothetical protein